tara:strand:- start:166 stop:591 length:426 start_codon:yes stop_codon:yes gene_type:complete
MKIYIGSDHAGFQHKEKIKKHLKKEKKEVIDLGPNNEESVDYPEFAHKVCKKIKSKKEKGILICGSGNGINMSANKHKNIRAALCWNKETAKLARNHNNANILSIPARFIDAEKTIKIVDVFLKEEFDGGRHEKRVKKINI